MKFRPCIDIHNGQVKQIVGGSLRDAKNQATENFVSSQDGGWYGSLYKARGLYGGHIILLNAKDSPYYAADVCQAHKALKAFPGGLQIGGGMDASNATAFLDAGASHIIVTSYVFQNGELHMEHLKKISSAIGKERLVLDLSCRKMPDGQYRIVTDRWQKFTEVSICEETFALLEPYCDEFLIHAVDVEGKNSGIEEALIKRLAQLTQKPLTYAGGIHSMEDIHTIGRLTQGRMDFTVGSALDLFGGHLSFDALCQA